MGGKLISNKPLFDGVPNFDGWAIESGQSPDYGQTGTNPQVLVNAVTAKVKSWYAT